MGLTGIGFLLFVSVFFSAIGFMSRDPFGSNASIMSAFLRAPLGIVLMIAGSLMMRAGSRGLAGSGVLLDPERAREDLEPWARAGGGLVRDALDEADVDLGGKDAPAGLTFDEKLRRLEALRKEGLLSEAEYRDKRAEVLKEQW